MEITFNKYKYLNYNLDFTIKKNEITGILTTNTNTMLNILNLSIPGNRTVYINNQKPLKKDLPKYQKEIEYITKNFTEINNSVKTYLEKIIIEKQIEIKDLKKKIEGSLKIIGLPLSILNKNINELSISEKKLLQISAALLSNPKVLILEEPFINLDNINVKKILYIINKLKDQYSKSIVLISSNSTTLYKYTTKIVIIKNNEVLLTGNTKDIFHQVAYLKRNKIDLPLSILITNKATEEKKIHLDYHSDIRDLIKDIYKHV